MSSQEWKDKLDRIQGNEILLTIMVIVAILGLIVHEFFSMGQPNVKLGAEGTGRVLLGLLTTVIYFQNRNTRKDVQSDTSATMQIKDKMENHVSPAIEKMDQKMDLELQKFVEGISKEYAVSLEKIIAQHRVERHDLLGQINALTLLKAETEHELKATRNELSTLQGMIIERNKSNES